MKRSFPRLLRPVKGQGKIHGTLPPLSMGRQRAGRSRQAPRRTPGVDDGGGYRLPLNVPDLDSALADAAEAAGGANSSLGTDIASSFSIAFWMYDVDNVNTGLVAKTSGPWNHGYGFDRWGRNPTFWIGNWSTPTAGSARLTSGTDRTLDTWHHIVGTYDGTTMELWFDGVSQGTATADHTLHIGATTDAADFTVGYLFGTASSVAIDDVGVWNRVLSSAEIAALSGGAPASNYPSGLVSYWTFDVDGRDSVGTNDLTITT